MTNEPPRFFKKVPQQSRKSAFERYDSMIKMLEERIEWLRDIEKEHPEESKERKKTEKILDSAKKNYAELLRKATDG